MPKAGSPSRIQQGLQPLASSKSGSTRQAHCKGRSRRIPHRSHAGLSRGHRLRLVSAERPSGIIPGTAKSVPPSHSGRRTVTNLLGRLFQHPCAEGQNALPHARRRCAGHKARCPNLCNGIARDLNIPKPDDHTPNTAIVTYKTPDGRTLFVDFMGTLIGLTNEEIRKTAVEFEHPDYGLIRVLHPTLVLKSRIVNLHRLQSKRDSNGIEQARLAVPVVKAFFEN